MTQANMKERDTFCRTLRDEKKWKLAEYKKVLYSDACHFAVNQRKRSKCWRRRGRDPITKKLHRNRLDKTQKKLTIGKVSTTVAAIVGWNYKSPLSILPRYIDGDDYIEHFLDPVVRLFFERQRAKAKSKRTACKWVLEEDNESAHGTRLVLNAPNNFKNKHYITQLKPRQPANLGDLSPIKNV